MFDRGSIFWCVCLAFDISFVIAVAYTLVTNCIKSKKVNKDENTSVPENKEGR